MTDDEIFQDDYRESPECRALLKEIESVIASAGTARTRYINERVTVPRKWSLEDIIAVSEKVGVVKGFVDAYTMKNAKKGIPKPDAFHPAKASRKEADWVRM